MLILMLGVFTFGSSSFSNHNINTNLDDQLDFKVNCQEYAAAQWLEGKSLGFGNEILNLIFQNSYHFCEHNL